MNMHETNVFRKNDKEDMFASATITISLQPAAIHPILLLFFILCFSGLIFVVFSCLCLMN